MTATAPLPFRRSRPRRDVYTEMRSEKRERIANRVIDFYTQDDLARTQERDMWLQRQAKYRQWTSGSDDPWPGASDQKVPDLTEASLRTQDTLHNAVMSARPAVVSRAVRETDSEKQEIIDDLHDSQFFIEQPGEKVIEEMAESFVNDPVATVYVPWVEERRTVVDTVFLDPLPDDAIPQELFRQAMSEQWPGGTQEQTDNEGWSYKVEHEGQEIEVEFYADKTGVQMVLRQQVLVHQGPRAIVKNFHDVFTPPRVANLQIPGPSNPGGAPHVILRDFPTKDEIRRLQKQGFYNLMTKKEVDELDPKALDTSTGDEEDQKDTFAGKPKDSTEPKDPRHGCVTRLMCFDIFDIDGDGEAEDVVFWVLLEPKLLVKVKPLAEMYPSDVPMRPLAEASYLPVKGRREGISLLELMEGLHDWAKKLVDQTIDIGDCTTMPKGVYRAASGISPEVLRLGPNELAPVNDVDRDIKFFEQNSSNALAFGLNMLNFVQQIRERLSLQGDLQAGRVPAGKASALRTVGGVQTILAQGEARPERILRRFFMMLTQIFHIMYQLNKRRLPPGKEFRVARFVEKNKNPFRSVTARSDIDGSFKFDFHANVLNSSKQAHSAALDEVMAIVATPLSVQLGTLTPDDFFRLQRDAVKARGVDPDKYLTPPLPTSLQPRLSWEDVVDIIMQGQVPRGLPVEGANAQFNALAQFMQDPKDDFGLLTPEQVDVFREYMQGLAELARQESEQLAAAQAAANQRATPTSGGAPRGETPTQVQGGELSDEGIERQARGEM